MNTLKTLFFFIPFVIFTLFLINFVEDLPSKIMLGYWFVSVLAFCVYVFLKENREEKRK